MSSSCMKYCVWRLKNCTGIVSPNVRWLRKLKPNLPRSLTNHIISTQAFAIALNSDSVNEQATVFCLLDFQASKLLLRKIKKPLDTTLPLEFPYEQMSGTLTTPDPLESSVREQQPRRSVKQPYWMDDYEVWYMNESWSLDQQNKDQVEFKSFCMLWLLSNNI